MTRTIPPRSETPSGTSYLAMGEGGPLVLIHGVGLRAEAWAAQMADDFAFVLKAPQKITHIRRLKPECAEDLAFFVDVDKMVGGDFEKGLTALKELAEAKPPSLNA